MDPVAAVTRGRLPGDLERCPPEVRLCHLCPQWSDPVTRCPYVRTVRELRPQWHPGSKVPDDYR